MGFWMTVLAAATTIGVAMGAGFLIGIDYGFEAGLKAGRIDSMRGRKASAGNEQEE